MLKTFILSFVLIISILISSTYSQDQELTVIGIGTFTINSQPKILTLVQSRILSKSPQQMIFLFGDEGGYKKMYGEITGTDTTIYSKSYTWLKTTNPTIGDSWTGWLPNFNGLGSIETNEKIVDFYTISVRAGVFDVFEVSVEDLQGNQLGFKMFSDGFGLIRWRIVQCDALHEMALSSYVLTGTGFWPMNITNNWVYNVSDQLRGIKAPSASATIDGLGDDWVGISPLIQDPQGDDDLSIDGIDIKDVYVATDDTNLYLMADFWDGTPDMALPYADVCVYQYVFNIDPITDELIGVCILHDGLNWFLFGNSVDVNSSHIAADQVLEISIPLANIPDQSNLKQFLLLAGNSTSYDFTCRYNVILPTTTDIDDETVELLPSEFSLNQNYPNPFNPSTTIEYSLPVKSKVTITVLNSLGQEITSLVNRVQSMGIHTVTWTGRDSNGKEVASGIYFYRLETDRFTSKRKMLLLK